MSTSSRPTIAVVDHMPVEVRDAVAQARPDIRLALVRRGEPPSNEALNVRVLFVGGLATEELGSLVAGLPRLEWIHSASSGLDRYIIPEIASGHIQLSRTADARSVPMAEHVVATALALVKRLPELRDQQRARTWRRLRGGSLAGSTVGFIGAGAVARAAASRFRAFDTETIALKRTPEPVEAFDDVWTPDRLDDLLDRAAVVVVACPLTDRTRGLLGREQFARMRTDAILVNVARGAIVVESDLIEALRVGRPAAAALDVFETEPLPNESPLWAMPNVIVTPHASSAAPGVWDGVAAEFLANLGRFERGEPVRNTLVAADLGY